MGFEDLFGIFGGQHRGHKDHDEYDSHYRHSDSYKHGHRENFDPYATNSFRYASNTIAQSPCPKCAGLIQDSFKFCPTCGMNLVPTSCKSCGTNLPQVATFCPGCGIKIQG